MIVTGYKIIMNNDSVYDYDTVQEPSRFLKWVSSQQFIEVYKRLTDNDKTEELTVFLSTKNISEIIPCGYRY
jgi:hypothetical protein